jgi:hypothetical protein
MRKNIIWISLFSFAMTTIAESSIASVNTGIFPLLAKNRKKAEPKDSVASDYKKLTQRNCQYHKEKRQFLSGVPDPTVRT